MELQIMKKLFLTVMTLFLFTGIGAISASAQVVDIIDATIPFDFTVNDTAFPAGEYSIKRVNSNHQRTMILRDGEGRNLIFFLTNEAIAHGTPDDTELIFNVVGNRYFLSKIFEEGNSRGVALVPSDLEKQLRNELSIVQNRVVIVTAQSR
jgi:hypothetical protein